VDLLNLESLPSSVRGAVFSLTFESEQTVYTQNDPATLLYVVESGRVRLTRHTVEGRVAVYQIARRGDSFGEADLFEGSYSSNAEAEIPTRVLAYPKPTLLEALPLYPELAETFIGQLVQRIEALKFRLELRDIRSARERVLRYLRHFAVPPERNRVDLDRPLKDVANDLGLTPETLSRTLTSLVQDGAIARSQRFITLNETAA